MGVGLTHEPLDFLLFSDFAVAPGLRAGAHLVDDVPIFNWMSHMTGDRRSSMGWRQQRLAHHLGHHRAASKTGDRARLDLVITLPGGRLLGSEGNEQKPQRFGGDRHLDRSDGADLASAPTTTVVLLVIVSSIVAAILQIVDVRTN